MERYYTKRMFLLLTPIMLLPLLISSSSSGEPVNSNKNGVSIAKEGRFPPSESKGQLPKLTNLEFKELNLCKVFHGKTCCSASRILSASVAVKSLSAYGEALKDCLDLFEEILPSGTYRICASFCDGDFEACSDACFSCDQVIVPCGSSRSIMCGKAFKWGSNGTAFCYAVNLTEPFYGSKSSVEPVVEKPLIKTKNSAWFLGLQFFWLVTVLVLHKMLLKRWRYQQQMRAMIQRM